MQNYPRHVLMFENNVLQLARETRQIYQDHYFLTDPDKFIFEFFPVENSWQLMDQPITLQEFEDLPLLRYVRTYVCLVMT